ncbi:hypothetical protein DFH06DRAFT_1128528 [Mycena polygramma]|nr:hypothetical protein DFH06DRAFT_1128528 [Mycena polygramma]
MRRKELPDPGIDSGATRRLVDDRNDSALNSASCTNGSEVIYIDSLPSSDVQTSLPSFFPPSLALLTRRPTPAPPPVLGKRSPESRPQEESPPPPVPKIRIPAALNQQVASSGRPQRKSPRKKASPEPSESSFPESSPPRKRQCKRNGNAPRIGCDEDIGFIRMRIVQDEDGESEAGQDEACDPKNVGSKTKPRGWKKP